MLARQDEHTAQISQFSTSVGQVVEVALDAKDIESESREIALRAEKKVDITAHSVVNLTVEMHKGFAQINGGLVEANEHFDELMSFLKDKLG